MRVQPLRHLVLLCRHAGLLLAAWAGLAFSAQAQTPGYSFGVLPQRSVALTAQYWNPILDYVAQKTGITLTLKLARSAAESDLATMRGEYDFVYSNHIFQPHLATAGYRVILRPRAEAIRGQIVVLADVPVHSITELAGREVGFPSRSAFVGYAVPMDHLLHKGVRVTPVFGGNQEGIMAQLKAGRLIAAGVNDQIMKAYAARERVRYRVLWESVPFYNLPIAVHPRVPAPVVAAVREAIDGMEHDPAGREILAASARVIGEQQPYGFRAATDDDYASYVEFYQNTLLKEFK